MQVTCCGYVLTVFLLNWAAPAGKCAVNVIQLTE